MNQTISYLDVNREDYEKHRIRDRTDKDLEGKQIINVETLEYMIRFWYKQD